MVGSNMTKKGKKPMKMDVTIPPTVENSEQLSKKDIKLFNEFVKNINLKDKKGTSKQEDVQRLGMVMTEYLKNFMVMGYNLQGDRVFIRYQNCPQDEDSLNEMLRQTFFNFANREDD